jgi:hypothetical protein
VKDGEPVDWRYDLGEDVYVIIKAPQLRIHIRKYFVPNVEWTLHPTREECVSQSLSFNLLQSLYCPLSSVLALCLQIKVWSFSVLSIRKDSGSLLSS